jgi:Zn-dependent protease
LLLPAWVLFSNLQNGLFNALFMVAVVVVVFGCVVLHELGHALTARVYGIRTRDITLYPIGGVARLARMSERPVEELLIALAGPAVNLVILALLLPLIVLFFQARLLPSDWQEIHIGEGWAGLAATFTVFVAASNALLVVFNMLPAFPSDGGRVLRALLQMFWGRLRATEIAAAVGLGMAVLIASLVFVTGNPMFVVVALFLWFAGRQELYAVRWQAEEAAAAAQPVATEVIPPIRPWEDRQPPAGFTGFRWNDDYRVWVRWQNGRPVEIYGGETE